MVIRSESEIYEVVERVLRNATEPLTCVALMDIPEVRKAALEEFGPDLQTAINKLSDALGFMWRRDVLTRHLAPHDTRGRARYAYSWREAEPKPSSPLPSSPLARKKGKPVFNIIESDTAVTIEFDNVTLIVRRP